MPAAQTSNPNVHDVYNWDTVAGSAALPDGDYQLDDLAKTSPQMVAAGMPVMAHRPERNTTHTTKFRTTAGETTLRRSVGVLAISTKTVFKVRDDVLTLKITGTTVLEE